MCTSLSNVASSFTFKNPLTVTLFNSLLCSDLKSPVIFKLEAISVSRIMNLSRLNSRKESPSSTTVKPVKISLIFT